MEDQLTSLVRGAVRLIPGGVPKAACAGHDHQGALEAAEVSEELEHHRHRGPDEDEEADRRALRAPRLQRGRRLAEHLPRDWGHRRAQKTHGPAAYCQAVRGQLGEEKRADSCRGQKGGADPVLNLYLLH